MRKLIFMNHILHLDENTLAKQIQIPQEVNDTNGLTREVKKLIAEHNLSDCFTSRIPKNEWKKLVHNAIFKENEKEIRKSASSYKKMIKRIKVDTQCYLQRK